MTPITRFGPQQPQIDRAANLNAQGQPRVYECGCCGRYHLVVWDGDCRDDNNRFSACELDDRYPGGWEEIPIDDEND